MEMSTGDGWTRQKQRVPCEKLPRIVEIEERDTLLVQEDANGYLDPL